MIHSDDGGLDLDCPGTSSSIIKPQSSGSPLNVSGWDELVEFYDAKSFKKRRPKESSSLPANKLSKDIQSGRTITCPLCSYDVCSSWSQNSEQTLAKMVDHLRSHEGELDSSQKVACTLCYNFFSKSELDNHYRECHGEQPEPFIEYEILYFTNSVHRQQGLINTYTRTLKRNSLADKCCIPADSLFKGYPTRRSIENCRSLWGRKFETSSNPKFLFRFKIRPSSSTPIAWACPLCTRSSSGCYSFSNDISARLFILRHFSTSYHDMENLVAKLEQEWEILAKEVGFDVKSHAVASAELLKQKERSCYFYVLRTSQQRDDDLLLHEMIARCAHKEDLNTSKYSICAVCFNPVPTRSLFRHFSVGEHKKMNVHDGLTEFREVPEIAESPTATAENFPYLSLRYSRVFKIKELGDADSMTFLKWRCCLASEIIGHVDDVLEFPTVQLLKIHALKHFETFHVDFFDNCFLAYEWTLLKRELPSSECARSYSPLKRSPDEGPFDVTDPNHFHAPYNMRLLPKYLVDIQVCGFCFWCGYSSQFLDHIVCHGYIDTGTVLSTCTRKEFSLLSGSRLSKNAEHLDHVESLIPNKILGSVGEEALSSITRKPKRRTSKKDSNVICATPRSSTEGSANHQEMLDPSPAPSRSMVPVEEPSLKVSLPDEEYYTPNSSVYDNDESDTSSIASSTNDFSGFKDTHAQSGVQPSADAQSSMAPTSTTDTHSERIFHDVSSYSMDDDDAQETASDTGGGNIVEDHKINILEKFTWEGPPPPPLDADQTEQLMMLSRNECPFCKTANGSRGLRVPAFANDEIKEECMIAHMVRFHHEDAKAKWVFEAKRYRMSTSKHANPLKFLLEPSQEGYLVCSSCEKASFPKLANLRAHWVRCVEVGGKYRRDLRLGKSVLMSPAALAPRKRRSVNSPVRCPVKGCLSAWRPSHIYPNTVGQIAHMLARHLTDKDAYAIALEIGDKQQLGEVFPYLSVSQSFAKTLSHPKTICLQCFKCDHGVRRPNELVQHAQRYHPSEEHYSGAPKCPLECGRKIKRRPDLSDKVLRLIHMFRYHLDTDKAVEWIRDWSRSHGDVMDTEPIYRFDVLASLEKSLSLGSPKIKCSFCENWYCLEMYLKEHRKSRSPCYRQTLADLRNEEAIATPAQTKSLQETSSLSITKRRKLRQCEFCSRAITQSTKYSERISKFLHALHVHMQSARAVQWLESRDYHSYVCEFPYLDIVTTLDTFWKQGKALHCAICAYETDEARKIANHAMLHQELMQHEGSYPDPCNVCGEQIPIYNQVKEPFQRLCHSLAKHCDDKNLIRDAIDAYQCESEGPVMLLDCQRTLQMFLDGQNKIACGRCDFTCSNGFALIEHAKTHDINVARQDRREIKRESPIVCPYCKRMLLCSARFSHRVTLLAHFVKFHRLSPEDVQDFTSKCATWNLTREFPYIDPALSIKLGKLQCAICEASLLDTAQILKHATIVHEGYKPNSAAEELVMEAGSSDMTLEWAGSTAEVQHPVRSTSFETFSDEKIFSKFSQTSEVTVSASAPLECTSQEAASGVNIDFTHSAEGKDEALFTVVTPKKELLSSSGRRLSRSYAPMNDRVPQLPSSSDDEVIREGGKNAITSPENLYSQGEARDEQENYEEAACTSKREEACNNTTVSSRSVYASAFQHASSLRGPSTSTPKLNRSTNLVTDSKGSLLSWLSPINGSIVPSRRAELISETQDGCSLRDALDNMDTRHGTAVKRRRSHHSSSDGTIFDELPQRMVQKIALKSKPPDDISHIKGAKGYPCNFCEFKARSVGDIRRHTSIAHSEILPSNSTNIVTPCHLCNEVFEKRSLLLKHITDSHAELQQPFKCAYCPKTYVTSLRMREHERRCHESRLFVDAASLVCPHCDKEFSCKRNRDQHVKRHKNPNSTLARGF